MSLTDPAPFILACLLGIGLPMLLAAREVWTRREHLRRVGTWVRALLVLVAIAVAEAAMLMAVFLAANEEFGFYNTWDELVGEPSRASATDVVVPGSTQHPAPIVKVPISADNPHSRGLLTSIALPPAKGAFRDVQVWLPPAYFEKSQKHTSFPVVVFVGSARTNGTGAARLFSAENNQDHMDQGKASPFIAVYVGGSVDPGVDSECTDVPGTQGETYLVRTLPKALKSHYRVSRNHRLWFITGASTGGWCAALAAWLHPDVYRAASAIAGYYHPLYEDPALKADPALQEKYSLLRRARQGRTNGVTLLNIISKGDIQAWGRPGVMDADGPDGQVFHEATKGLPGIEWIVLESGGHQPGTWLPYVPVTIQWFGRMGL